MSTSIMGDHRFFGLKVVFPANEFKKSVDSVVHAMLSEFPFPKWMICGFSYRCGTPVFDGVAPDEVTVLRVVEDDCYWTDRRGLEAVGSFLMPDWSEIVGCQNISEQKPGLSDLAVGDFVMLSSIDSAHWICVAPNQDRLSNFGRRLSARVEPISVQLDSRAEWGL